MIYLSLSADVTIYFASKMLRSIFLKYGFLFVDSNCGEILIFREKGVF